MKTRNMTQHEKRQRGFTLIELIIVIVLLGILGAMGAGFISEAFRGFFGADARMEMYEEGKSALVRMEREIHIAVPNAVNVSTTTIADDTISIGLIDENAMSPIFGKYTETNPTTRITDPTAALPVNTLVSIYNTSWDVFADSSRIYSVASLSGSGNRRMNFTENIGLDSPHNRYYAVRTEAVRFSVTNGVLSRSTATVTATNPLGGFGNPQPLASNIVPSNGLPYFTYAPGTSSRNSMVAINFAIARNDETVSFHKEIDIRNVP
jgi:MSHA biogenesis protein MshO